MMFAVGVSFILVVYWLPHVSLTTVRALVLAAPPLIVLLVVAYWPTVESAMLADAHGDPAEATQAVVLCFSYQGESPSMRPGPANEELLAYVRNTLSNVRTVFVQEGIWVAVPGAPQAPHGPNVLRVVDHVDGREVARDIVRFHIHNPARYLNTLEALFCASRLMDASQCTVLVAHELQLARAEWDLRKLCPECKVVTPLIRGISFVPGGAHPQAWSRPVYKLVELFLSRPSVVRQTDWALFRALRARFTFSRMSLALAVQMKGLGFSLWRSM